MPIDTKIDGSPDDVRSSAEWLRGTLAGGISQTVDTMHGVRNTAGAGWDGDAGDAFGARMASSATKADELETAAADHAGMIDKYAGELQRAQAEMQRIRDDAAAAGLTVDGFTIQEPGPAPPDPGAPPWGDAATPAAVSAYNDAVAAVERHAKLVEAYNVALDSSAAARQIEKLGTDTLNNALADVQDKWFFVVGDLINGTAGGLMGVHASTLMKQSKFLAGESVKFADLARSAPPGTPPALVYRDFDESRRLARNSDDAAKAAERAQSKARLSVKAGGALAVGGVVYDIANGKDVDQAVVSGGVSFGASVAAGALIGSAIPVPVLGTAAGALGGAVVGVFASGAVDSLYENGIGSVGEAISDGADAVVDTGKAVGGLAKDAWNAIF